MSANADRRLGERRKKSNVNDESNLRNSIDRRQWATDRYDRRSNARLSGQIPISISFTGQVTEEYAEVAVNTSLEGLRVVSQREFPINSEICIGLFLPEVFVPLQAYGTIRWRKYSPKSNLYSYGISFDRFLGDQQYLKNYIEGEIKKSTFIKKAFFLEGKKFLYNKIIKRLLVLSRSGMEGIVKARADLGTTFEHVYSNNPEGQGRLGVLIDKIILNLPAAKASRYRKMLIQKALVREIRKNISQKKNTRILDVASGTARYISDAISTSDEFSNVQALCVDKDKNSLIEGRRIAGSKPIRFAQVDIFKLNRLEKLFSKTSWKPNVIIISGLIYYLNDERSKFLLNQVMKLLEPGGLLILTNMVNNPNKDLIGHLFLTKSKSKWIPLARKPHVVQKWLTQVGFQKIQSVLDPWKMYAVFTASKSSNCRITELFEFQSGKVVLKGKLHLPAHTLEPLGCVLFIHGLGYTYSTYQLEPDLFCENSFGFSVYNMRGHGNEERFWDIQTAILDVRKAIDNIYSRFGKKIPIFLMAHSTGGLIAFLAAQYDYRIRGISLINIVNSVTDSYLYWHHTGFSQSVKEYCKVSGVVPPWIIKFLDDPSVMADFRSKKLDWSELEFPCRYGLLRTPSFKGLAEVICNSPNLFDMSDTFHFPVILFGTKKDELIAPSTTKEMFEKIKTKKKIVITEASSHFQEGYWSQIQQQTLNFFRETLGL